MTRCHICGCSCDRACPVGCAWVGSRGALPLCSVCRDFAFDLQGYIEDCNRVTRASLGRLFDLAIGKPTARHDGSPEAAEFSRLVPSAGNVRFLSPKKVRKAGAA